ncbi:hypothetical protein Tco_0533297 [Tanacetum coccineum]
MLQARENLMEAIQAFLKKYDQIHPKEKSMDLLLAEERFLKVKQAMDEGQNQPENVQELLLKLLNDLQILNKMQLNTSKSRQAKFELQIGSVYFRCLNLIESLLNQDTSMVSSPKIDSLLEEFSGELAHIDLIPPRIDETDFDPGKIFVLLRKFKTKFYTCL